ncbi:MULTISPECIES: hypothetical protein [Mycobacterium]|uniref:hypothetical protein n=1 Tax=Mycobacterium TaxID=1763 RepID=UPI00079FE761|nr:MULTISPECIES: hypothetical protein [Mycobacterium]MCV7100912.1 DNA-binding protein [Mycobacterium palustre]MDV3215727.1 helix-turn-helix domain-containing protein [Mycobacterium avium]
MAGDIQPVNGTWISPYMTKRIVRWLGDYIDYKRRGAGIPEGLIEAQRMLAEAYAATGRNSRQQEPECSMAAAQLLSGCEVIDTAAAAAELGCTADNVRQHWRKGNLEGRKVGRQLMITVSSLQDYKSRRSA